MDEEKDKQRETPKNIPVKDKFDLEKFLKDSAKAGEILAKKEQEKDREHVEL